MQNISSELKRITTEIENQVHYGYLEKYIQKPQIDQERLFLLYNILLNHKMPLSKKDSYIITTMLVQLALDTHDLVNNEPEGQSGVSKTQQLNVLAGDYYSSLYYLLLSEIEERPFIHTLAVAIREINEAKIKLYYHEYESFEELLNIIKIIESTLYTKLALFIEEPSLVSYMEEWILLTTLSTLNKKEKQTIFDKMSIPINDQHTTNLIELKQDEQLKKVKKIISELPERHLTLKIHSEKYVSNV